MNIIDRSQMTNRILSGLSHNNLDYEAIVSLITFYARCTLYQTLSGIVLNSFIDVQNAKKDNTMEKLSSMKVHKQKLDSLYDLEKLGDDEKYSYHFKKVVKKARSALETDKTDTEQDVPSVDELIKMSPSMFLKTFNDVLFKHLVAGGFIKIDFYPATFGILLESLDKYAQSVRSVIPDNFFVMKLFGPLNELSEAYSTVIKVYEDGFVDLFPKKYVKKKPTFSEFVNEIQTPAWNRVRGNADVRRSTDPEKMTRRINLLNELSLILKIPNAKVSEFNRNPQKFIETSMQHITDELRVFDEVKIYDREMYVKYNAKDGKLHRTTGEFGDGIMKKRSNDDTRERIKARLMDDLTE